MCRAFRSTPSRSLEQIAIERGIILFVNGPEMIIASGAAKAVEKIAGDAQQEAKTDRAAVREAARGSAGLERAGEAYGRRMAVREEVILALWKPLAKFFGVSRQYFDEEFAHDLAAKLEGVPEDDLSTPRAAVVAPAIEALGYSLDEPSLKEMYLNLLAAASTSARAADVHPSFVDTIRQLDSREATLLDRFLNRRVECARIVYNAMDGRLRVVHEILIPMKQPPAGPPVANPPELVEWIINWERLGLVRVDYEFHSIAETGVDPYAWVRKSPEFIAAEAMLPEKGAGTGPVDHIDYDRGYIEATARGRAFHKAVS